MGKDKFGREPVRAISDPHTGKILTDQMLAPNDNWYQNLAVGSTPTMASCHIEGVVVKAVVESQGGLVYVIEEGKDGIGGRGYPLANLETISIATEDLNNVIVFVPAAGDGVAYIAIRKAE